MLRRPSNRVSLVVAFLLFSVGLIAVQPGLAQTYTWSGSGGNSAFNNGANWFGGVAAHHERFPRVRQFLGQQPESQ